MAEFPALPLWTDAYMAACSHLSDAEHGRYLMMLMHMWRMPGARFPADDVWLARKFGRSAEVFVSEWKPLMQEFMQSDGNWWTQKRMQEVHRYVLSVRAKKRDAANSRWQKEKVPSTRNASKSKSISINKKDSGARATRWPHDCRVPIEWLEHGMEARERNGLPEINLMLEAEKFTNFWSAKSGANAAKLDWRKTWINWALRAEAPRHGNKTTAHDKFLAAGLSLIVNNIGDKPAGDSAEDDSPDGPGRPLLPS